MSVPICSVAADMDHLIEVPLQQAQVKFTVFRAEDLTTVFVSADDVDRARTALAKYGTFEVGVRP